MGVFSMGTDAARSEVIQGIRAFFLIFASISSLMAGCATVRGPVEVGVVAAHPELDSVALRRADGSWLRLRGPARLLDQLARLPGAAVEIPGRATGSSIRVRDFVVLEAEDGMRPLVGRLIVDQSGVMIADEDSGGRISLQGPAVAALREQNGARLWITGTIVGPQRLIAVHWGLLLPPP